MAQSLTIPQPVLERYHAGYDNTTFGAFSAALAAALGLDPTVGRLDAYDERHHRLTGLLTDTALELVGAEFYTGAALRLGDALGTLDAHTPRLVELAIAHLERFATGSQARETVARMATLALAEFARRALVRTLDHAALLPGWRGTVPYDWLLACALLIQSAEILLREDPGTSYLDEKFGQGVERLARGADDMLRATVSPPAAVRTFHARMGSTGGRHVSH